MPLKQPMKVPIAGIASITIAATALFFAHNGAYLETRPTQGQSLEHDHPSVLQLNARLWQDPFAAIDDYERTQMARYSMGVDARSGNWPTGAAAVQSPSAGESSARVDEKARELIQVTRVQNEIKELATPLEGAASTASKHPLTILAVTMPGNASVGAEEWRRRERYAVVSALGADEFAPSDDEHIGFFVLHFRDGKPIRDEQLPEDPAVRVPFEIFDTSVKMVTVIPHHVLLLWVDDAALSRLTPTSNWLQQTNRLITFLAPCAIAIEADKCPVRIIGPSSSDLYMSLAPRPAQHGPGAATEILIDRPLVFSPYVTSDVLNDTAVASYTNIISTIPPDQVVLTRIARELYDRDVSICDAKNSEVVLLSEWDTEYGRRASASLNRAIQSICSNQHARVEVYSFMRGLDGALLAPSYAGWSAPWPATEGSTAAAPASRIEWPETADQRDYVRRMGERIAESQRTSHGQIKAIGIMASDTHDKLLLLQALRQRFPDLPFFTTDADARLFHPAVQEWTRNIIVGSAFGLTLAKDVQVSTPPFRDVYQTSVYLATLLALQTADSPDKLSQLRDKAKAWSQRSELFEVGKSRLVRLCPERNDHPHNGGAVVGIFDDEGACYDSTSKAACGVKSLSSCSSVIDARDPDQLATGERLLVMCMMAAIGIAIAGFAGLSYRRLLRMRKSNEDHGFASRGLMMLSTSLLLLLIGVLALSVWLTEIATGSHIFTLSEPGVLTQGVSSAPVALCWAVALSMTVLYLELIVSSMPRYFADLEVRFVGPAASAKTLSRSDRRRYFFWWMWSEFCSTNTGQRWGTKEGAFHETWELYKRHSFSRTRILRIIVWWVLMCLLPMLLITPWFPRPTFPIRGEMHSVVGILAPVGFMSLMVLMAVIADTVLLCSIFVVAVGHRRNIYPPAIIDATVRRYELLPTLRENADCLLDTEIIAARTSTVARYLYYPFVVMAILALGLFASLEHWARWPGRFVIIGLSIGYIGVLWTLLRWSAERARATALEELEAAEIHACSRHVGAVGLRQAVVSQCRLLSKHVSAVRDGAYAALQDQPMVRAILLPIGGAGAAQILQYLSTRLP